MPAELLLPLFTVVLALNALFVGLAIRSLWGSRGGEPRTATWTSLPVREELIARSIRERGTEPGPRPVPADGDLDAGDDGRPPEPVAIDEPDPEPDLLAAPEPTSPTEPSAVAATEAAAEPQAERGPPARPALDAGATSTPTRAARRRSVSAPTASPGSRRRFALPPLDDDHEKVRRSIETFLGGAEGPTPAVPPDPTSILTVAVIGLAGPVAPSDPRRSRRSRETGAAEGSGPADLRAMLERTVRSTARGTDVISLDRHGRVRVILPGTGELAAHAYLRRIRAIVEPIAESATPPARVVVATATDLDGSVASARRRADRRFATALQGRSGATAGEATARGATAERSAGADHAIVKPRASGD